MYSPVSKRLSRNVCLAALSLLLPTATGLGVGLGTGDVIEGIAGGLGAWAVLFLVTWDHSRYRSREGIDYCAWGALSGTAVGAGIGVAVGFVVGNLAFFSIGVGVGLSGGLLAGYALDQRHNRT